MTSKEIFEGIATLVESSFVLLEKLENLPNTLLIIGGFVGLAIWLTKQARYDKQAATNPNQLK